MVVVIWFSPILLHLGQDWAKIPTSHCAGLISNYKKCLAAVTAAKEGRTRYWKQRFTCFCDAQICNTGLFFSINKLPFLLIFLSHLFDWVLFVYFQDTRVKIWCFFGSYLHRNIKNSTFKQLVCVLSTWVLNLRVLKLSSFLRRFCLFPYDMTPFETVRIAFLFFCIVSVFLYIYELRDNELYCTVLNPEHAFGSTECKSHG